MIGEHGELVNVDLPPCPSLLNHRGHYLRVDAPDDSLSQSRVPRGVHVQTVCSMRHIDPLDDLSLGDPIVSVNAALEGSSETQIARLTPGRCPGVTQPPGVVVVNPGPPARGQPWSLRHDEILRSSVDPSPGDAIAPLNAS